MDLDDLSDQLRTLVGMIMEDVSDAALLRAGPEDRMLRLQALKEANADIGALIDAASVIERRQRTKP